MWIAFNWISAEPTDINLQEHINMRESLTKVWALLATAPTTVIFHESLRHSVSLL